MKILSIIVPIFNEERTILKILDKINEQNIPGWTTQIIIVDDGSTDNTHHYLHNYSGNATLLKHRKNKGKGASIKTALRAVTGEAILIQDGDLEYDPNDYLKLINAFETYNTRAVYGSRNLNIRKRGYLHYFWGGKLLTMLVNLIYKSNLTDINTCYKLIDTQLFKSLKISANRFNFCEEVTIKLLKRKVKIKEIPISYNPRKFSEGKKLTILDGMTGLWTIIKLKYS